MRWTRTSLTGKLFLSYMVITVIGVMLLFVAAWEVAPTFLGQQLARTPTPLLPSHAQLEIAFRQALLQALVVATTLVLATALVVSLVVSRWIVRPIRRMLAATQHIAAGHYAARVSVGPVNAHDELGALAAGFNVMAGTLEQTEQRRLELIGDVAHEMRTPLASLEGYLEGLLDGVVTPSERTWAKLHDEAGRLRRLVDDLQELSRAEARQIPLVMRPTPPGDIVQSALDRLAASFIEKGVALHTVLPAPLPLVQADHDRAVQVLTNVLLNALRYTRAPGRVEVTVTQTAATVTISVSDSGLGIAPAHLAHIFERFYRVDKSRSRALGGSGVGLTIARALAEAMGGQVQGHSAGLGQGSTFTFILPIARRPAQPLGPAVILSES